MEFRLSLHFRPLKIQIILHNIPHLHNHFAFIWGIVLTGQNAVDGVIVLPVLLVEAESDADQAAVAAAVVAGAAPRPAQQAADGRHGRRWLFVAHSLLLQLISFVIHKIFKFKFWRLNVWLLIKDPKFD